MASERHVQGDMNETTRKAADQTAQASRVMSDTAEQASRGASEAVGRDADAFSRTWRTIVTSGMQNVSGEWMRFMQNRVEENLKRFDEMMSCRTIHDCFAIQAQIARDNCEAAPASFSPRRLGGTTRGQIIIDRQ